MASNPQIISDLKVIMEAKHNLELLITFKGVPFICKARVDSIEENLVRLTALDPAMVCLLNENSVRVLGSDYFEPSVAKVMRFDTATGAVDLCDFSYAGTKLGERAIVRVQPKDPIEVILDLNGSRITSDLVDISLNGIGVRILFRNYNAALKAGTQVRIHVQLPNGDVDLSGMVLGTIKSNDYQRLSIRFGQDVPQRGKIFRYLVDRRKEIEKELMEAYQTAIGTLKIPAPSKDTE